MVDPNRKINRLTDKDIEFLDECDEEFGNRYSEEDTEFMEHCANPSLEPPIVESWNFGSGAGHGSRGGSGQRSHYGGGNRGNHGWNRRGGEGDRVDYHRNNYNKRYRHEPYSSRGREDRAGHRSDDSRNGRSNEQSRPPMNIRRDYGNFVAASKSDE